MNATQKSIKPRTLHLDGIRGVAALSVALFHFCRSFDNSLISGNNVINQSFLSAIWNGHFAVALFFVLSGFLFFDKFRSETFISGAKASVKRFLRLSIPIFTVCLTAYAIHKMGLFSNQRAASISASDWLARWYTFDPSFALALFESVWIDFVAFDPSYTYNSNLWTISYELFAVVGVIFLAITSKKMRFAYRMIMILLVSAICYGTHYYEFFIGAALALAFSRKEINLPSLISIPAVIAALSISPLFLPAYLSGLASDLFYPVGAVLLIAAVSSNGALRRAFSNKIFLKLGELSFGLYLTHFITINSIASSVYIATQSVLLTFICYIISTLAMSYGFNHLVDQPWTKLLNHLFRKRHIDAQQALNLEV
ncbi:acyltransferase family protein [Pseudomonas sp. NPDC078863]|jgi:peptidoglycan/LPS O-acetylase OafA/YrhL|uniref:acyltransferase family protein n=1 Tax=unclassified Pseudomonas TaxID=196821 RepID=UPI0037CB52C5